MSLFVCENCSKVENHSSVYKDGVYPGNVEGQWNMGLMEMHGQGDKDLTMRVHFVYWDGKTTI
jgi:hypothetical protein